MTRTIVTVPEGMSPINALYALWQHAKPTDYLQIHSEYQAPQEATMSTAQKVFEAAAGSLRSPNGMDYLAGRAIKMNFTDFPKLYGIYDSYWGDGAAKKALEQYNQIPPCERFDRNDSYRFQDLTQA